MIERIERMEYMRIVTDGVMLLPVVVTAIVCTSQVS